MDILKRFATVLDFEAFYVRCLPPKNMPMSELQTHGMSYEKEGNHYKSIIEGKLDLSSGKFEEKRGKGKPKIFDDGYKYLLQLNLRGYGVYFLVHSFSGDPDVITANLLFHESDSLSLQEQQATIDRITSELGKPSAVVTTKKSLHAYWRLDKLLALNTKNNEYTDWHRRWLQYSGCDDLSLTDAGQLMRLPGFDHLKWNADNKEIERVRCELIQENDVSYSLDILDRLLPELDLNLWVKNSLKDIEESEPYPGDMRLFAPHLDGYKENGRDGWDTVKCPYHNGESDDSLHIDRSTGGFICHAGCKPDDVYRAAKARAINNGYRFPYELGEKNKELTEIFNLRNSKAPNIFSGELGNILKIVANNFNIPVEIMYFCLLPILASRIDVRTKLLINPGTNYCVRAIRWSCLIGDSGSKKTPVMNVVLNPLRSIQTDLKQEYDLEFEKYKEELDRYKRDKAEGEPEPESIASMTEVYFDDFTIESIASYLSEHPNDGNIIANEELAQFFNSIDLLRKFKRSFDREIKKARNCRYQQLD